MRKIITSVTVAIICIGLSAQTWQPVDPDATPEANSDDPGGKNRIRKLDEKT